MVSGLKQLLEQKKCFKLICGAGNENLDEVEKLVALYAKAGCRFFDLCASEEVLEAAQKGLDRVLSKEEQAECNFCLSVGIKNEPHLNKARINSEKCKRCEKCVKICPQHAISEYFKVKEKNCVGCLRCKSVCNHGAIEIYQKNKQIEEILSPLLTPHLQGAKEKDANLSPIHLFTYSPILCIELHASGVDEEDVQARWDYISKNFDGVLSLCIDRSKLSNEQIVKRIEKLIEGREPYSVIIQADGAPMSGGEDDYKTTLQAVAMAEIIQNAKLPVYILLSGGTNSKTAELADKCGIDFNGVSVGSYARKIVNTYIEKEDFLTNSVVFSEALAIAKNLVKST